MATVAELKVAIGADISEFNKKFAEVSKSMEGIGKKMSSVGKSMSTYVTLPLLAAGAASIKMASDVDKGLREVNTLLADSEKDFAGLQSGVASLSQEIGVAQDVLTKGLYSAISAGVPKANVFEFMRVASKAAIAGVTDTETAIDGITTSINAYGLKNSQAEEVANSMFAAVQGGKTTFEELSASMSNVAPAAAAAKVSMQEVNAAIATLTAGGTPTAQATTQIRAALVGLQKPSEEMDGIFQKLGFNNAQLAIESKGLQFALDAVTKAAGGNNGKLTTLLGSVEAVSAANVLSGTSAAKFTSELERQKNAAGLMQGAFDEMEESNSRAMEKMTVGLSNAGIAIGNILLPFVSKLAGAISKVVNWFTGLDASTKKWIVGIAAVVAAIGPLLAALGFFVSTIVPAVAAGWVIMTGPVALIVAAIVGLVAAFIYFKDEIFASVSAIIENFKAIPQAFMDAFSGIGKILKAIFTGDFAAIPELLKDVGKNILKSNPLVAIGRGVAKGFTTEFGETVEEEVPEAITESLEKSIPKILPVTEKMGSALAVGTATAMKMQVLKGEGMKDVAKAMFDALQKEFPKVTHKPLPIKIEPEKKELSKFQEKLRDLMSKNPVPMFLETTKIGKALSKAVSKVAPKIGAALAAGFGAALSSGKAMAKGMASVLTGGMDNFGGSIDSLINGDIVGAIVGVFGDFAKQSEAFSTLMSFMNDALGGVMKGFMPVFDQLVIAMRPLVGIVTTVAGVLSDTLMGVLKAIVKPIISILLLITDLAPIITKLSNAISGAIGKALKMVVTSLRPLVPVIIMVMDALIGLIEPLMSIASVIFDALQPVLQILTEIIGGVLNTALLTLAPILELLALSLMPLIPIFELLALSLTPIVWLFDLLGQAITALLGKLGMGGGSPSISMPALAKGGIVTGPTTALIGEAGPEAVIPLSKLGSMGGGGGNVTFRIQGTDLIGVIDQTNRTGNRIG